MKIRCDRVELAERLQSVAGIVSASSTTKPILQNFLLRTEGDLLVVEATDLDISARIRVERVEVEREGQVTLEAARLVSLVREIPGPTVLLEEVPDSRAAVLRAEGFEFRLLGDDPAEFPEVKPFASEDALEVPREKLIEMLRRVGIAAARDSSRYQLTGVYFQVEGDKLTLTATDGKRLANDWLRIVNPTGKTISAIVPNRAVDVLGKVLAQGEEMVKVSLLETEIQVSFGAGQLMAKLIEGSYPEYRSAMPTEKKTKVVGRRADFMAAVRSASLTTDKDTSTVLFRFEADTAHLESQSSDIGESKIQVPISCEGEPLQVRFNPVFFIDALRIVNEEQVRMEFCGPDRPGSIRAGVNYRHMLMPLVVGS